MALAALGAAIAFAAIAKTLFDRGLLDRNTAAPDIRRFYTAYRLHTPQTSGRVGGAFWIHCLSVGLFIAVGVIYTAWRCLLPLLR